MPRTSSRASTDAYGPCSSRWATIAWAVDGPMPGRASSSSAVARLRSIGPDAVVGGDGPGGAPARGGAAHDGHVDLRPVDQRRGEVDGGQVGVGRRAAGGLERGVHPCDPAGELVHARAHHRTGDVDDQAGRRDGGRGPANRRPARGRDPTVRGRSGRRGGTRQPGLRRRCRRAQEPPPAGHHGDHGDADGDQAAQPEPVDPRPAAIQPAGDHRPRRIRSAQLDRCRIERIALDIHEILLASARRSALGMRGMSVAVTLPEGCQNKWAVSLRR